MLPVRQTHKTQFTEAGFATLAENNDKPAMKVLTCNPGGLNATLTSGQASCVTFMNSHGGRGSACMRMCIRAVNTTLQWGMTHYSLCSTTSISAKPGMASASLPKRVNVGRLPLMVVALHSWRGDRKYSTGDNTVQRQKCTQTSKLSVMHNPPE